VVVSGGARARLARLGARGLARAAGVLVPGPRGQGRLEARTTPVARLEPATRDAMWRLYAEHYERVDRARFDADLDVKRDVILLHAADGGALEGFSTLDVSTPAIDGQPVVVVFSGDTIISARFRGQTALQRAFFAYVMEVALAHPGRAVWWHLISKGFKTYLLLSRNFAEYWPRFDRPTPPEVERLLAALGRARFGAAFDAARGLVRFTPPGPRLRAGVAPLEAVALQAPDVAFFAARNPGHADGDELQCVGRLDLALARFYLARMARRALGRAASTPPPAATLGAAGVDPAGRS
jgi:hypothetical protein